MVVVTGAVVRLAVADPITTKQLALVQYDAKSKTWKAVK